MCHDDPIVQRLVALAGSDLKRRLGPKSSPPVVTSVKSVTWPDASLGCPEPGKVYATVMTPGYRIEIESGGIHYCYHADRSRVKLHAGGGCCG